MKEFYFPEEIEPIVQKHWLKNKTFKVHENVNKEKYYCLSMFPYPSGNLHIGHVRNYTIADVIARYQRMLGKNVLHPMGWDAFGLPAEEAAIKNNILPELWTYKNIYIMKNQLKSLGFSYDWDREIITCEPQYYRWEQWFFTILYKNKLVYKKDALVNWCPKDKTVLANEQVIDYRCWRCESLVEQKKMSQWFIKITKYANQLLNDLDKLKYWPKKVKDMQKNWIGRSEGIEVTFTLKNRKEVINVYIFNLEKFMSINCILLSMDHPLLSKLNLDTNKMIYNFVIENFENKKKVNSNFLEKKIVLTKLYAIHPLNNKHLKILIANFLNIDYNVQSVVAIANYSKFNLKLNNQCSNITFINHKNNKKLYINIFDKYYKKNNYDIIGNKLIDLGIGKNKIHYRLRDWNISRQRYWGVPIPMITLPNGDLVNISSDQLPIILPKLNTKKYISNYLKYNSEWIKCIYKNQLAIRETDTFDTFMESSWYYARFTCPNYNNGMIDPISANYWLPVDQYIGGIEHAVMHLMYFRFYHKLLRDFGFVNSDEPVKRLLCQGMVLTDSFYFTKNNSEKVWVSANDIVAKHDKKGKIIIAMNKQGQLLTNAGMCKMSKSKNNGIDPQTIITKYGADTLRLYIMFASPVEMSLEWKESGIKGANRFLKRLWKLVYEHCQKRSAIKLHINLLNKAQREIRHTLYKTIIKVTDDTDRRQTFNTAIASIMTLVNKLIHMPKENEQDYALLHEALVIIVKMLYPYTPHISFVLWKALGNKNNIDEVSWPAIDNTAFLQETKLIIIQINGKFRGKINVPLNADEKLIYNYVAKEDKIMKYIKNSVLQKTVYIKDKLINFILS